MKLHEIKILTGEHAGKVVTGIEVNLGRDFNWEHGIKVEKLNNQVFKPKEFVNLNTPFDKFHKRITIGDKIIYGTKSGGTVNTGTVIGFGKVHHHGCGWRETEVKIKPDNGGKIHTANNPMELILGEIVLK
jgi:hypothetical protein